MWVIFLWARILKKGYFKKKKVGRGNAKWERAEPRAGYRRHVRVCVCVKLFYIHNVEQKKINQSYKSYNNNIYLWFDRFTIF